MSSNENDNPLVSIVIPAFNREQLIAETLDSIAAQFYRNWECIIVDDGSTDETASVVQKFALKDDRIKYFDRPLDRPKGANVCRNYGFEKSSGTLIQWFDSDDLMEKDYLELMVGSFNESVDVVICGFQRFGSGSEDTVYNINLAGDIWELFYTGKLTFNTQPYLYRKEKISDIRFDEKLSRAQDLDYVFRVFRQGIKSVKFVPKVLIRLRQHPDTITEQYKTRKSLSQFSDEMYVRRSIMDYAANQPQLVNYYPQAFKKYMMVLRKTVESGFIVKFIKALFTVNLKVTEKIRFLFYGLLIYSTGKGKAKYYSYLNRLNYNQILR